jgi:hypothetical protein
MILSFIKHTSRNASILILIAAAILAFVSCSHDAEAARDGIFGHWQWDYSTGGITGARVDPKPGSIITLNLTSDLHFSFFRNDQLVKEGTFQMSLVPQQRQLLNFGSAIAVDGMVLSTGQATAIVNNGALVLADYYVGDGIINHFK